jgi:septal ring factor EnvC (AmiA/AmiB activator)
MNDSPTPPIYEFKISRSLFWTLAVCLVLAVVAIVLGVKNHSLDARVSDTQGQLAQTKAEAAQSQSDLMNAKAASAQLESQLNEAKSQQASLQSQFDRAKSRLADLQPLPSQLDTARAQLADLQSQLATDRSRLADLQGQLKQANDSSSQLLAQLDQAKSESMDLHSRLQKAESENAKPQAAAINARPLPFKASYQRTPFLGLGWSLTGSFRVHIKNINPDPLNLHVTIFHLRKTQEQYPTIAGGAEMTLYELDPGDKVTVVCEGYDPVNLTLY